MLDQQEKKQEDSNSKAGFFIEQRDEQYRKFLGYSNPKALFHALSTNETYVIFKNFTDEQKERLFRRISFEGLNIKAAEIQDVTWFKEISKNVQDIIINKIKQPLSSDPNPYSNDYTVTHG